jgi:hypothetical protein
MNTGTIYTTGTLSSLKIQINSYNAGIIYIYDSGTLINSKIFTNVGTIYKGAAGSCGLGTITNTGTINSAPVDGCPTSPYPSPSP